MHCKICGLPGKTKCTEQANCLNIPLEAEIKYLHGGKREGAGRKQKFNEKTETVSFRCPVSKIAEMKILIKRKLKLYENRTN